MFDENSLSKSLAKLRYQRIKRLTYKAFWGTEEVEHFLYFSLHGKPKEFLAAQFGVRNPIAESFSLHCIHSYGGPVYQAFNPDVQTNCTMIFSLGKLARWGERSSLFMPAMSVESLAEKISADIQENLLPIVQVVTSLDAFLALLLSDVESFGWIYINGAIRAAQVASIAFRLGANVDEIRVILHPFDKLIKIHLPLEDSNSSEYLDRVIEDLILFHQQSGTIM